MRKIREKISNLIRYSWHSQRVNISLSKGTAMMLARDIDLANPSTWEFSGFSQNGEDGILDVLRRKLLSCNRYFVEIGSEDGIQNNSAWLVVAAQYNGLMIDGNAEFIARAKKSIQNYSIGTECHCIFLTRENVSELKSLALHLNPDVFSLDIDGNDYHIVKALLETGFRPKIFVVEYNSVFGWERRLTIAYQQDFNFRKAHPTQLYYGVSIAGWRKFFSSQGYQFVTVDQNGVNAFFVDPSCFNEGFLRDIKGLEFAENRYQLVKFRMPSELQFELIIDQDFIKSSTGWD